ncbi:MAG: MFS transporter [Candidatus Odinarchaeota archaeon]|nr:MFS transporter [Candidatus Odinarchaeota archaeon]
MNLMSNKVGTPLLFQYPKPNRTHWKILMFSLAGWIFDFYDLILYSFLMMPIQAEFGLTNMEVALVYGFSLLISAVGGVVFGIVADRLGRKTTLIFTLITYSAGTLLCAFSTNVFDLLIYRSITGFGVGGEWAVAQALVNETFPPNFKGRAGAILQTGAPIGVGLSAVIGGFLMQSIGWRASFFYSALPSFLIAFLMLKLLPESDLWLARHGRLETNLPAGRSTVVDGGFNFIHVNTPSIRQIFSSVNPKFLSLGTYVAILGMMAYWLVFSWLPTYLTTQHGFDLATSGLWIILSQVGAAIGYLTFGVVADKIGRRVAFSLYAGIQAIAVLMITVIWINVTVALVSIFLLGVGTGYFSGYGPLYAEVFPTDARATASGLCFNVGRGMSFFAPLIIASVSLMFGMAGGMALAILFNVLLGLSIWLFPETKGKILDEGIL